MNSVPKNVHPRKYFHINRRSFVSDWKPFLLTKDQMNVLCKRVDSLNVEAKYLQGMLKFSINDYQIGLIGKTIALTLKDHSDIFHVDFDSQRVKLTHNVEKLILSEKSDVINRVNFVLYHEGLIPNWTNTMQPVFHHFNSPPLLLLEKAAAPFYGIKSYSVHVNGYIRDPITRRITHMWVGHRSKKALFAPGTLDNLATGQQPYGTSLQENMLRECQEEASIPAEMAKTAKPVGTVSYSGLDGHGHLKRDTVFCYDLDIPAGFLPAPPHDDSDIDRYEVREMDSIIQSLSSLEATDQYKPSANLVIIDFFIRHGLIDPESPYFVELASKLRRLGYY